LSIDASTLWVLHQSGKTASCEVASVPLGIEVRIFRNRSLLTSRTFLTEAEALAWAEEERDDLIGRGWSDGDASHETDGADALPSTPRVTDFLIVSIGHDTEVPRECYLCAQWFTSHTIQCVASARLTDAEEEIDLGFVCDDCIAAGVEGVRDRIDRNARVTAEEDDDADHAQALRRLRDAEIALPSAQEVRGARAALDNVTPNKIH
jgi:hypothetical protein